MGGVLTTGDAAARRARRSVELTRGQMLCVALLVVVPLPVLSLGALVAPLPQLIERAAAGFIPFASPRETTAQPAAVDLPARAPRGRRTPARGVEARTPSTPAAIPARPRRASAPTPVKKRRSSSPARATVPSSPPAPVRAATQTAAPASAPAPPAQAVVADSAPVQKAKRSGHAKKPAKAKGPPPTAGPPATSAPTASTGHGNGAAGHGSDGSNAGGNGNAHGHDGADNGGGGNGGGNGKDGH